LFGGTDVVRWTSGSEARILPIEYKRGRPKESDCDRVQLCAQALCLEEMLGRPIGFGELFCGRVRRRVRVELSPVLRQSTTEAARRLHELIRAGITPRAEPGRKCDRCSLRDVCLPRLGRPRAPSALGYFDRSLEALLGGERA